MHASLYVAVHKSEAQDAQEACSVVETLLNDNGFCYSDENPDEGGYSDWLEIGGRWSGYLAFQRLAMVHGREKAEKWHDWAAGHRPATKNRNLNRVFRGIFGKKGKALDPKEYLGTNAVLADKKLIRYMLKEGLLKGDSYHDGGCLYETCSVKKLLSSPDKSYWLVVVDFHS